MNLPMSALDPAAPAASLLWPRLSALGCFLVPGLALAVPSGYSWGAVLLLLASMAGARTWWRQPLALPARCLLASIAAMGTVWLLDASVAEGVRSLDRAIKYFLALPCWLYLLRWPPAASTLWWGLACGGVGAGLVALYQRLVLLWDRASGFTNAIQFGGLAILLALMCVLVLAASWQRLGRAQRAALACGAVMGVLASLLSLSRGGWLALALSLPLWAWLLLRWCNPRVVWRIGSLLGAAVVVLGVVKGPAVAERWTQVYRESVNYWHDAPASAQTSNGHRLEHWRLALSMGSERPLLGWGLQGYVQEKQRRVAAGQVDPVVLEFGHAHNEWLDLWAKRGLLGLLALVLLYGVPLWLFWPSARALGAPPGQPPDPVLLALHLCGLALPVLYLGFGLSQVFFAHNSGNMFYLFMLALCYSCLQRQKALQATPGKR